MEKQIQFDCGLCKNENDNSGENQNILESAL